VSENYCCNCGYKIIWDNPRCLTKYESLEGKNHLKNDLIRIAEENWTDSQVKMLKGLICAAVDGIEYSDAYEVVNRD
jgi:hypothetical protein